MVGDSDGDLRCAEEVGCRFLWAGWNERVRDRRPDGEVVGRGAAGEPDLVLGDFRPDDVRRARGRRPFLRDLRRDLFTYLQD